MREYFVETLDYQEPEARHRLCLILGMVTLQQNGRDSFAVRYGKQVKAGLTYDQACDELGQCLMHQAVCEGEIDL